MNELGNKVVLTGDNHQWYMTVEDVAEGYGVRRETIMMHLQRHHDELRDGIEKGVTNSDTLGGPQQKTVLYREGVIKLGFFVRSVQAKEFRQWATNLVVQYMDATGMTVQDLFQQMNAGFAGMREQLGRMEEDIAVMKEDRDRLWNLVHVLSTDKDKEEIQGLMDEVILKSGKDGRTVAGHVRKTLGTSGVYETANPAAVKNVLRNMLGKGVFGSVT